MKHLRILLVATLGANPFTTIAGESQPPIAAGDPPTESAGIFERAIRPVTSPTLWDQVVPRTQIHPIFIQHRLPDRLRTTLGDVPVGGDVQLYALQFELALGDRFSLVAAKDGYVVFSPDSTLSATEGWANLSAGFKYAFLLNPDDGVAAAFNFQVEVPTGNSDVFQGEGDGVAIPSISFLKLWDKIQYAENFGLRIPFDNGSESTILHTNLHLSYAVTDRFSPLVELSYFRVLDEGDGGNRYPGQVGGLVPAVATFEGGDLFNLGSDASNKDLLTVAAGFRYAITDRFHVGAAYEIPLTDEEEGLIDSRITVDATVRF